MPSKKSRSPAQAGRVNHADAKSMRASPTPRAARSRLTSRGQITIPADVRKKMGVKPGDTIMWRVEGDAAVVQKANTFHDLVGCLAPHIKRPIGTFDQERAAVREAVVASYRRGLK